MTDVTRTQWVPCPACGGNTRTKVRADTVLYHQPVFCPKCRKEFLVNVRAFVLEAVKEISDREISS